jgi:maleylacetate reductase
MSIISVDAKSADSLSTTDPGTAPSAYPPGFTYNSQQYRVVFGAGSAARLNEEVERLGIRRVLVLTTREQRDQGARLGAHLGSRFAELFSDARMHTPVEVTEAAIAVVQAQDIDGFVAIGGGSTIGLGKALSLRTGLPHIAMPTTYAGSEMTPILGETRHGVKTTQRSQDLIPDTVIYDVDLTLGLPPRVSAASGMNAIAHAVEALYAEDANPLTSLMAEEGIAALARALPRIIVAPSDGAARHDALYGAWLCGTCLGAVGMSLHHKLCHVLGGSFDLPHAETHAIVLMRRRTTPRPLRRRWSGLRGRWGRPTRRSPSTNWHDASDFPKRWRRSACRNRASTAPPTWRFKTPMPIRGRSTAPRCAS